MTRINPYRATAPAAHASRDPAGRPEGADALPFAPNTAERFFKHVEKSDHGCWLWMGYRDDFGYGRTNVVVDGVRRHAAAHRLSYALANGWELPTLHVLHRCDNPPCVRPDHLFLGTNADNVRDMISKGRRGFIAGEAHGNATLTDAQCAQIRARYRAEGLKRLSAEFHIHVQTVFRIAHGLRRRFTAASVAGRRPVLRGDEKEKHA